MHNDKTLQHQSPLTNVSAKWIAEGWRLAHRESEGAFETIEIQHDAELAACEVQAKHIAAEGSTVLERRNDLDVQLQRLSFNRADYLRYVAHGTTDLGWAMALFILNAALAVFVLLAFGPAWLTVLLSLLVMVSSLPIEEFFHALEERSALREGIFLTLAVLALGAQFWLGTVRGLFLAALSANDASGPVSHAFARSSQILQYTLGMFSLAGEIMCGYKLSRARSLLLSTGVKATRARDKHTLELSTLYHSLETTKAEARIRRAYRVMGARQYLAWAAGEERRATAMHLRKAIKGTVLALVLIFLLLFLGSRLGAAPIPRRTITAMLDLSKSVSPPAFQSNVEVISEILTRLHPEDRLVIVGITASFGEPRVLFDETLPTGGGYLNLRLQADRETLVNRWYAVAKTLRPTYGRTDVIGALSLIPYLIGPMSGNDDIIVLSDLQNSTPDLDLEHARHIAIRRVLNQLRQKRVLPQLTGAQVFMLGVDPIGKDAQSFANLRDFWIAFFHDTGAHVCTFTIGRDIVHMSNF